MTNRKGKTKQYGAATKVAIVRKHLIEKTAIADICDEYKIHPSAYYRWQNQFFERGEVTFMSGNWSVEDKLKSEIKRLERKLAKKDEVLAEVMEEYVGLKKRIGD